MELNVFLLLGSFFLEKQKKKGPEKNELSGP